MKRVCGCLVVLISCWISSCQKDAVTPDTRLSAGFNGSSELRITPPLVPMPRPDTITVPRIPLQPRLPIRRAVLSPFPRCIHSFDELVSQVGPDPVLATAVILENGVRIGSGPDLPMIRYTAVRGVQPSSLFRSQLLVKWRPDAEDYWRGFSADVWSVGCVYTNAAIGPFTNLLKGGVEILINTCFFWAMGEYTGMRIKYLVLE